MREPRPGSNGARILEALTLHGPMTAPKVAEVVTEADRASPVTRDYANTYLKQLLDRELVQRDSIDGVYVWRIADG